MFSSIIQGSQIGSLSPVLIALVNSLSLSFIFALSLSVCVCVYVCVVSFAPVPVSPGLPR